MIELCAERGYEGVTVRGLARTAAVSTRSFYKHFANVEECFVSAYDSLMDQALCRARASQNKCDDWEACLRTGVLSTLDDVARHPNEARLVLVEAFSLGPAMQPRMRGAIAGFEQLLVDILGAAPEAPVLPQQIICGMAAAVMRVARHRVLADEDVDVETLAEELGDWMLSLTGQDLSAFQIEDHPLFEPFARSNGNSAREDSGLAGLGGIGDDTRRILSATIKLAVADGVSNLTVPKIRAEAGVSRRSFDSRFANVRECFLGAIEAMTVSAAARLAREAFVAGSWEVGIHRTVWLLCAELTRNPRLARLAFVNLFEAGREGLECRESLVSVAARQLSDTAPSSRGLGKLPAEASAAAAWRIVHSQIVAGRVNELSALAPTIAYLKLAPGLPGQPAGGGNGHLPIQQLARYQRTAMCAISRR
jgi:AcrR family transcriptional regulator